MNEPNSIKAWRKKAGLTQAEMSLIFGIPKRTIENWEGGQRSCPEWAERLIVEKLMRIAEERKEK